MEKLILTVEDTFQITNRGLVLAPEIPPDSMGEIPPGGVSIIVRLNRPDGTKINTQAKLLRDHFRPGGYKWMCWLEELEKSVVPIGTKAWALEDPKDLP